MHLVQGFPSDNVAEPSNLINQVVWFFHVWIPEIAAKQKLQDVLDFGHLHQPLLIAQDEGKSHSHDRLFSAFSEDDVVDSEQGGFWTGCGKYGHEPL